MGGLRWSDIDLDAGRLTVMRGYTLVPGARGDRPTKTRSVRTVTLDPGTVAELRAGWATACSIAKMAGVDVETRRACYVFGSDPLGLEAWRPDTANAKWVKTRNSVGLTKNVRLHDLRHTHASFGAAAGLGLPIIGKLLGHKHHDTTQRYAHLDADPLRRASERIGHELASALGQEHRPAAEIVGLRRRS